MTWDYEAQRKQEDERKRKETQELQIKRRRQDQQRKIEKKRLAEKKKEKKEAWNKKKRALQEEMSNSINSLLGTDADSGLFGEVNFDPDAYASGNIRSENQSPTNTNAKKGANSSSGKPLSRGFGGAATKPKWQQPSSGNDSQSQPPSGSSGNTRGGNSSAPAILQYGSGSRLKRGF